ncbi:MAG TPA: hypothetical protein VFO98_05130 [Marmoricola sp.]|jgi:hypothetical protein|nr:hypothetical protein [Marmoricola sp.]
MDGVLKKGAALLVVLFLGFYLFTDPNGAAGMARDLTEAVWGMLVSLFEAVIEFIGALGD